MPIGSVQVRKTSETRPIFQTRTFCLEKKKKPLDLQVFCEIGKTISFKYYHEHQRTCNTLIKFSYLMASKLLSLLMDWETFN